MFFFSIFSPSRCASKDQMCSRDTWRTLRRRQRPSTRTDGCTRETLANGFLYVSEGWVRPRSSWMITSGGAVFKPWFKGVSLLVLLQNGTLKITDRKKHIFKLAQGEYIAPEKIETVYSLSDPVAQIFVHGDSLQVSQRREAAHRLIVTSSTVSSLVLLCLWQACLVGIVVPDPDFLPIWIKKKGIEGSYSELCNNKVRLRLQWSRL